MNTTAMINKALFAGLRFAMMEEDNKIPTNSGFCEELIKPKKKQSAIEWMLENIYQKVKK